jgi:hypothetical protein
VESHQANQHLQQHFLSKAEHTNTHQDLTGWVITTSPNARHERLLAGGVLLLKNNKSMSLLSIL